MRLREKLLDILRDTGSLTQLDVIENCRRLRRSPEEISAAVCGNITVAEQRLLKHLLHKIDSCREDIDSILADYGNPYLKSILCQAAWAAVIVALADRAWFLRLFPGTHRLIFRINRPSDTQ